MTIPFRVKLLTETAKLLHRNCESDLWDLFADDFCIEHLKDTLSKEIIDGEFDNYFFGGNVEEFINVSNVRDQHLKDELSEAILTREISGGRNNYDGSVELSPQSRILVKTGIAIELPIDYGVMNKQWYFENEWDNARNNKIESYAVADIRPRSGLALKHGITVLNTPGTIDNSYRKEIGVVLYNAGHEPYTIKKGDKIAQMLIRPLYPSSFEIVEDFGDTGRGGFGSTGK